MFFTSGTTGYPKMVMHDFTYPLGHYHHRPLLAPRAIDGGLHFTISDTGWGKALWGKLYGQWLCEQRACSPTTSTSFHAADDPAR